MTQNIPKSEIRKAYLLDKYVIITPGRATRPRDTKEETIIKRTNSCPFCPKNIDKKNICDEIVINEKWRVISIKNIFPALTLDNEKAYGKQEVIVENRNHMLEMADLNERQIKNILKMYTKRTKEISKNKKINYILCFKNQGSKAGASIVHSHSQVFASQILPPNVQEELRLAQSYKNKNRRCAYCDILSRELKGPRFIWEDKYVGAFSPYASRYHYEAWVFTKRHIDNITNTTEKELSSIAKVLKKILLKLQNMDLSFNLYLHQVISDNDQHFYIKIQPRESVWAGVELGSGLVINSVSPEVAAEYYRK